jgi:hypothetical protein
VSTTVTTGFIVLACGHWLHAAVSSEHVFQVGTLVNCDQCAAWQPIAVVTG